MFWFFISFLAVFGLCILAAVIFWQIAKATEDKSPPKKKDIIEFPADTENVIPEEELDFKDYFAVAEEKRSELRQVGKYGSELTFFVVFRTDDGQRLEYTVPKEVYGRISEKQEGILVVLNGNFFDFGDGNCENTEEI